MKIKGIEIPNFVLHILALPLLPIALAALVVLWILRQVVRLYLQFTHGDTFGGLIGAADRIYTTKMETSRKIISSMNYIRSDRKFDFMKEMRDRLENKVFNKPDHYPKLLATHHNFLGQDYLLKNRVTMDTIVRPIPFPANSNEAFDEEYLKKFSGKIGNNALPKNDTAMWEVLIGSEPLENFDSNLNTAQYISYLIYLLFIGTVTIVQSVYFRESDVNPIHGPPLSGEKLIAWATEYDTERVAMVKSIKNRIPNTRFSDVVFACVSASMFNFFKKNNLPIPKKIGTVIPILFYVPPLDKSKPVDLKNDFTFAPAELPMVDPLKFLEGLEETKTNMEHVRKSSVKNVFYWVLNYINAVVPGTIQKMMSGTSPYTAVVSSVPGGNRVQVFGDCELLSNMSAAPNTNETGVTFTILSYDNTFHICLLVDKALVSEQEHAQFLVDDILRNIQRLNEDSLRVYG